jgi:hypothetical protein
VKKLTITTRTLERKSPLDLLRELLSATLTASDNGKNTIKECAVLAAAVKALEQPIVID